MLVEEQVEDQQQVLTEEEHFVWAMPLSMLMVMCILNRDLYSLSLAVLVSVHHATSPSCFSTRNLDALSTPCSRPVAPLSSH